MSDTRLDRILSALAPDDAAYLASLVEAPWKIRARRLDERDTAIREALAGLQGMSDTARARELATRLLRYLAGPGWASDRDRDPEGSGYRALLHRIAAANRGEALSWRQIMRAAAGHRGGVS